MRWTQWGRLVFASPLYVCLYVYLAALAVRMAPPYALWHSSCEARTAPRPRGCAGSGGFRVAAGARLWRFASRCLAADYAYMRKIQFVLSSRCLCVWVSEQRSGARLLRVCLGPKTSNAKAHASVRLPVHITSRTSCLAASLSLCLRTPLSPFPLSPLTLRCPRSLSSLSLLSRSNSAQRQRGGHLEPTSAGRQRDLTEAPATADTFHSHCQGVHTRCTCKRSHKRGRV